MQSRTDRKIEKILEQVQEGRKENGTISEKRKSKRKPRNNKKLNEQADPKNLMELYENFREKISNMRSFWRDEFYDKMDDVFEEYFPDGDERADEIATNNDLYHGEVEEYLERLDSLLEDMHIDTKNYLKDKGII